VALEIVNSCQHGNGTALFTRSGPAARKFQDEVQVRGPGFGRLPRVARCRERRHKPWSCCALRH
jgi:hypothetical protein